MSPKAVVTEANTVVRFLVEVGLSDDQNYPFLSSEGRRDWITFSNANQLSMALKDRPYEEVYRRLRDGRVFCVLLPDGALLQLSYEFMDGDLVRHRLAYLPAPDLVRFDEDPELYADNVWFADVISRAVVAVPVRFDFDNRLGLATPVTHPCCHLTLGQFIGCRIPVSKPIGPCQFTDFVLRCFYSRGYTSLSRAFPSGSSFSTSVIHPDEEGLVHVRVP